MKQKKGKKSLNKKEKAMPKYAKTFVSDAVDLMRKQGHYQLTAPKKSGYFA